MHALNVKGFSSHMKTGAFDVEFHLNQRVWVRASHIENLLTFTLAPLLVSKSHYWT